MTVEDLVTALLAIPPTTSAGGGSLSPVVTPKLRALFEVTDINKDGLVSFAEFRVLSALLQLQNRELSALFRLADKDKVGALTVPQLAMVLYTSTGDEALHHSLTKGYLPSCEGDGASTVETTAKMGCTTSTALDPEKGKASGEEDSNFSMKKMIGTLGVLQHAFNRSNKKGEITSSFLCKDPSCAHNGTVGTIAREESGAAPRCTEADILALKEEVEEEIWTAEFMRFADRNGNSGTEEDLEPPPLSAKQFMQLVASRVIGPHPPYYLEANIRKLSVADKQRHMHGRPQHSNGESQTSRGAPAEGVVPLSVWLALNNVMKHAEEVSDVFAFFTATGNTVRRENITNVFRAAGIPLEDLLPLEFSSTTPAPEEHGTPFSSTNGSPPLSVIDLLFAVFDKNGDGEIDLEECLSVLRQGRQFYYRRTVPTTDGRGRIGMESGAQQSYLEKLHHCASELMES